MPDITIALGIPLDPETIPWLVKRGNELHVGRPRPSVKRLIDTVCQPCTCGQCSPSDIEQANKWAKARLLATAAG